MEHTVQKVRKTLHFALQASFNLVEARRLASNALSDLFALISDYISQCYVPQEKFVIHWACEFQTSCVQEDITAGLEQKPCKSTHSTVKTIGLRILILAW
jgi:hypothetical protein